ncbi:MAG: AGE family epimerase/isomerase [Pseudomonadota bacterium]
MSKWYPLCRPDADPSRPWLASVHLWTETTLNIWAQHGYDQDHGGFHDQLTQTGQPEDIPKRCRVQARQIYSFIEAGRLGWEGPWQELSTQALAFMLDHYRMTNGAMRSRVNRDGTPYDDVIDNYDQAFAIFALAHAYRVIPDQAIKAPAIEVLDYLRAHRAHPGGGFFEDSTQAPDPRTTPLLANPHMHLLEAALAWLDVGCKEPWQTLADEIVALALGRFIDSSSGALREFFDLDWQPVVGVQGRLVEPGHLFEWQWLLQRYANYAGPIVDKHALRKAVAQLYAFADRFGLRHDRTITVAALLTDGSLYDGASRVWPQTERIKAAMLQAQVCPAEAKRYHQDASEAWYGLSPFLTVPMNGLWYDRITPSGKAIANASPASSLYHLIGAMSALLSS